MNKIQRFISAVKNLEVDRPPVTTWVHFQSDHLSPEDLANLHIWYHETYDWDFVKVMNDYRYPVPDGINDLSDPSVLSRYEPIPMHTPALKKQLTCLKILRSRLGPDVPIIETLFEPYQQIIRNIGFDELPRFFDGADFSLAALEAVTKSTCEYIDAARPYIDGIFISINGAIPPEEPRGVTEHQHATFLQPFTARIIEHAAGLIRILHAHGTKIQLDRIKNYPYEVLHVSDRIPGNPSLTDLRKFNDKCIMGGINELALPNYSLSHLTEQIKESLTIGGPTHFILAPGCTIPSFTSARTLHHLRNSVEIRS